MTEVGPPPPPRGIPNAWKQDRELIQWIDQLIRFLHDQWVRSGGGTDTLAETNTIALSNQDKLDLIAVTQAVDLDAIETSVDTITTNAQTYAPSNESTDRSWDANAAAGAITNPPTQAEVENIRDAVLELSDVLATLTNDLNTQGITQ